MVSKCYDKLSALLEECGLLQNGKITVDASTRLWSADEKGFDSSSDKIKYMRVAAPTALGRATSDAPGNSFGHITMCPFLAAGGLYSPAYVVMTGTSHMRAWKETWPEAHVSATPSGGMTAALWTQYVLLFHDWLRTTHDMKATEPVVLIIDSGGGSLIHLSTDFTMLCWARNLRPFVLPPYVTSALMPNDQQPNALAEKRWQKVRAEGKELSTLAALDCMHEVFDYAFQPKTIVQGWAAVGIRVGHAINRDVVLVERGQQLFRSTILPHIFIREVLIIRIFF